MELRKVETSRLILELANRGYAVDFFYDRESVLLALTDSEGTYPDLSVEEQTTILQNAISSVMDEVESLIQTAIEEEFETMSEQ